MSVFEIVMIYIMSWWICLFCVLPFGAKPPEELASGIYPAAPAHVGLARKLLHTTWISAILSGVIIWALQNDWVLSQLSA